MLKEIGEIILHEKIDGKDMPTSVNIFDFSEVEIVRSAEGSKVTVYKGSAERFLRDVHFVRQFANSNEVDKKYKDWRK